MSLHIIPSTHRNPNEVDPVELERVISQCEGVQIGDLSAPQGAVTVVLLHRGLFSRACVLMTEGDVRYFDDPWDNREKRFFHVPLERLRQFVSDDEFRFLS